MRTAENEPQREKRIQLFNFVEFIEKVKKKMAGPGPGFIRLFYVFQWKRGK